MKNKSNTSPFGFNQLYKTNNAIFGTSAEPLLNKYYSFIDKIQPVLDIGSGQGRNSFFLHDMGFTVIPIDPSTSAIESFHSLASDKGINLQSTLKSFSEFSPEHSHYSAILVFGLIPVLSIDEIQLLVSKLRDWTKSNSIIFINAFTITDTSYKYWSSYGQSIGPHSYQLKNKQIRTFLNNNELLSYFPEYEKLYQYEGFGPWHKHGDSIKERHSLSELVLRRK